MKTFFANFLFLLLWPIRIALIVPTFIVLYFVMGFTYWEPSKSDVFDFLRMSLYPLIPKYVYTINHGVLWIV